MITISMFRKHREEYLGCNIGDIVNKSLPINKVIDYMYYKEVKGASKDIVLGYVTFTDSAKKSKYNPY